MTRQESNTTRSVAEHLQGVPSRVGSFVVSRLFPRAGVDSIDPFLMLDFFDFDMPPNAPSGNNAHPHRGFETVTILVDGEAGYRDSLGNRGVLETGSVEWMTAGAGIVHDGHGDHDFARRGGHITGIQLWVNLPANLKMIEPSARYISPDAIPVARLRGGHARVIAGKAHGVRSPHQTRWPIHLVDYALNANHEVEVPIPEGWNAFLHVSKGNMFVSDHPRNVVTGELVRLGQGGTCATLTAGEQGARVLLAAGQPINEPIASWGPFVMNTKAQLIDAQLDYEAGRMGSLPRE